MLTELLWASNRQPKKQHRLRGERIIALAARTRCPLARSYAVAGGSIILRPHRSYRLRQGQTKGPTIEPGGSCMGLIREEMDKWPGRKSSAASVCTSPPIAYLRWAGT